MDDNSTTDSSTDSAIEVYYLSNIPTGQTWTWFDPDLLVVEATLDGPGRRQAIDEAFADAHTRAIAAITDAVA